MYKFNETCCLCHLKSNLKRVSLKTDDTWLLCVADLFNNPVAQEADYRLFVIHSVPSVELLDRQGMFTAHNGLIRLIFIFAICNKRCSQSVTKYMYIVL